MCPRGFDRGVRVGVGTVGLADTMPGTQTLARMDSPTLRGVAFPCAWLWTRRTRSKVISTVSRKTREDLFQTVIFANWRTGSLRPRRPGVGLLTSPLLLHEVRERPVRGPIVHVERNTQLRRGAYVTLRPHHPKLQIIRETALAAVPASTAATTIAAALPAFQRVVPVDGWPDVGCAQPLRLL